MFLGGYYIMHANYVSQGFNRNTDSPTSQKVSILMMKIFFYNECRAIFVLIFYPCFSLSFLEKNLQSWVNVSSKIQFKILKIQSFGSILMRFLPLFVL